MKNHYQTLGLKFGASEDDIKNSYRKLAQKFHPDKNNGDDFFTERFNEVREAYDILSNAPKRKLYDKSWSYFFDEKFHVSSYKENDIENFPIINDRWNFGIFLGALIIIGLAVIAFFTIFP